MKIPEFILDCAAFVYSQNSFGEQIPIGTAFFACASASDMFLVTAKHLIKDGEKLSLRYNSLNGKADFKGLPNASQWTKHHADESVDLAVLRVEKDWVESVSAKPVPIARFYGVESEEYFRWNPVGIGDEVMITGLLVSHPGNEKNVPIVRRGLIAALPAEAIQTTKAKSLSWRI